MPQMMPMNWIFFFFFFLFIFLLFNIFNYYIYPKKNLIKSNKKLYNNNNLIWKW
uniref:ATP synthase F0 subunit 8 n=1 Tax=Scythropia crataegella TaxID=753227 RepID=UPI002203DFE5|nr:ATP synthase F0 subunit 8 [Scythropia crataegella]UXW64397.1 ATP synthase F0 subunit 8 [Scythropia crataegella]